MKKRFIAIIAMLLVAVTMTSCSTKYKNAETKKESYAGGYFTIIKEWHNDGSWRIIYANDTKVMYIIYKDGYRGGMSPLYNSDGSLQVYAGED